MTEEPGTIIKLRHNPDPNNPERMREHVARVELNADGIPVILSIRCQNRECCPVQRGHAAYHLFTLWGVQDGLGPGRFRTVYLPLRTMGDLPIGARKVKR